MISGATQCVLTPPVIYSALLPTPLAIPAAELHAPFALGRGAHADGGGEEREFTLHFGGLFTVTISPPLEIMFVDKGRLLLALDVNSDCMGLLLNEFGLTVNVEGSKILATVCFFSSSFPFKVL